MFIRLASLCGVAFATFLFGVALYDIAASFNDRVVWSDEATTIGKYRTLTEYTLENANWRDAPKTLAWGFAYGFAGGSLALIFGAGVVAIFL
jgi:hypothetical protein